MYYLYDRKCVVILSWKLNIYVYILNVIADVVTEFIEGLVETYPGLQYLDGFPLVITRPRADASITCVLV